MSFAEGGEVALAAPRPSEEKGYTQRGGGRRNTQMLFTAFLIHPFICIGDALVVPSTSETLSQHPGALGAAEAMSVEQISISNHDCC